jgi:hypothetical protein
LKGWDKFSSSTKASSKGTVGSTHTLLGRDGSSFSSPLLIATVAKNSKGNKSGRIIGALCWGPDWLRRFTARAASKFLTTSSSQSQRLWFGVIFSFKALL